MAFHFDLHRFGIDEFAVGHLINGDLPDDDRTRWKILQAPCYRIGRLLDEHQRAQAALRDCQATGRPFVLYLRSFSAEHCGQRVDGEVLGEFSLRAPALLDRLADHLATTGTPIVKLHGGADGLVSSEGDDAKVLSTDDAHWRPVAAELVQAAAAIVFLVGGLSAGVAEELALIRAARRQDRCLVVRLDPADAPGEAPSAAAAATDGLADFPVLFTLRGDALVPAGASDAVGGAPEPWLDSLLAGARTTAPLDNALGATFTYLEPAFTRSEDHAAAERQLWQQLRVLRSTLDPTYWSTLEAHGIPFAHFTSHGPWALAHRLYGLAIATADFAAIREALRGLRLLAMYRGATFAAALGPLSARYAALATRIFPDGPPDTEAQHTPGPDPLTLRRSMDIALKLFEYAEAAAGHEDADNALYFYQTAVISALRATDRPEAERQWIAANMCRDWARFLAKAQPAWAAANGRLAAELFRDLAHDDPVRYRPDLALSLNNLGALHFAQQDLAAADQAWGEALAIRRALPADDDDACQRLTLLLANVAMLRAAQGQAGTAQALRDEALAAAARASPARAAALRGLVDRALGTARPRA